MADEAIQYIKQLKEIAPGKPWLVYYVPGATHSPHHPTPEWIKKISDMHLFDDGWNKLRETIFANQKQLGIMPENAQLTPCRRNCRQWDTLSFEVDVSSIDAALARADRGEHRLAHVDMGLVAADALRGLAASIEVAGARVEVGPMPAVSGNRPELVRLVQNLVANSLRYVEGRPGPYGFALGEARARALALEVSDTGSGFSAGDTRSGTGLGLGICREIAEPTAARSQSTRGPARAPR